jgi:hypothetical protein
MAMHQLLEDVVVASMLKVSALLLFRASCRYQDEVLLQKIVQSRPLAS